MVENAAKSSQSVNVPDTEAMFCHFVHNGPKKGFLPIVQQPFDGNLDSWTQQTVRLEHDDAIEPDLNETNKLLILS